ncbi:flagellar hook-length control protein FliK [Vibrio rumoiensis]|uniref:flagellar hook-length control protein FliK n=1 Tax=Vibrio rumoiensis TaxID=76258 RepID=UPI003AA8FF43
MNISNSPVSILNNVNTSPKNGETAPTPSHVESSSLMGSFSRFAAIQKEAHEGEVNKEQSALTPSYHEHSDKPERGEGDIQTDADIHIDAEVQPDAVVIDNSNHDTDKAQSAVTVVINPNTDSRAELRVNTSAQPAVSSETPVLSPSSQTIQHAEMPKEVTAREQKAVPILAANPEEQQGEIPKNQTTAVINEHFASPLSEKPMAKGDTSRSEFGIVMAKEPTQSTLPHVTPAVNNASVNIQTMDMPAIQFTAKVQVDIQQPVSSLSQQLNDIIKDKVDIQISAKKQNATIRLDPPELGKLEVKVRIDGDKLFVTVNANHAQTREAVSQGLDRLRADLNFNGQVSVDIGNLPNESPDSAEKYLGREVASTVSTNTETTIFEPGEKLNVDSEALHTRHAAIARI